MAELLSGWQGIATITIIISIILAGIAVGLGRAFSFKKLERFGINEIFQSILNGAILGSVIVLSLLVVQVGNEFTPQLKNVSCISNSSPSEYALCGLNTTLQTSSNLSYNLVKVQNTIGYYQTLNLHFGNFSIQPLVNLNTVSSQLAYSLHSLQLSIFVSTMNAQFLAFISSNWFGVIFATGLVLRSFFLSRKFGAFLIAVSIAFAIFYPLAILMFPLPIEEINTATLSSSAFLSNTTYQTIPIIDLNDNNAIADKIYNMSFTSSDLTGDLTYIVQHSTNAASSAFFYSVIVSFFALLATIVLIKELSHSFAGEIATEISQV